MRLRGCSVTVSEFDLVLIEWKDPTSHKGGGWSREPKSDGAYTVWTVGWITQETKTEITIHSSVGENLFGHDTVLPRGCIVSKKILRRAKHERIRKPDRR